MRSNTSILSSLCVDSPPEYGTTLYCVVILFSTFSTETGNKLIKLICAASDSISEDNIETEVDGEVLGTSHNLENKWLKELEFNAFRLGIREETGLVLT